MPSPKAVDLYLDNQLCFALYATSLAMGKTYRPLLAELGLTYPQYVVLMALWQHGEMNMGVLGKAVALDSGTLTPLLRKLVVQGLVQRARSAQDERSVLISLTATGSALRKRAHSVRAQVACNTGCSAQQGQVLLNQLHRLRAALLNAG